MTDVRLEPALSFSYAMLADGFNRAFEGYAVKFAFSAQTLEQRVRAEHIDLSASRVALRGSDVAGILLIARRGSTSRIAGMGVAADVRRSGLGRLLTETAIRDARDRGERRLSLEVLESNGPALALYRSLGFRSRRRLVGYRRGPDGGIDASLREIDPSEFARAAMIDGEPDLPWQIAPETFAATTSPHRAFSLDGGSFALVARAAEEAMVLRGIVVPRSMRRTGAGARLARALFAAFAGCSWRAPAVIPEHLAPEFFARLGFELDSLAQLEMSICPSG